MKRTATLALVLAALAGCGPEAALWVRVEAPLAVPEECDALILTIRRDGADGPVSFEETFQLRDGPSFPLTLSLTAEEVEGRERLWVEAEALLGETRAAPWARAAQEVQLRRGDMAEATISLCDCP